MSIRGWMSLAAVGTLCGLSVPATALRGDDQPANPPPILQHYDGVIRVVGPDGRVQERRFGQLDPGRNKRLEQKLQELREAAGDREEVERISQELLDLVRPGAGAPGTVRAIGHKYGIGVSLSPEIPSALRAQLKLGEQEGVLVQSVADKSPAAQAGLQEYDILLKIGDEPIDSHADLVDAVQEAGEAGAAISLEVLSAGERKHVEVTVEESEEIKWPIQDFDVPSAEVNLLPPGARVLRLPPGVTPGEGREGEWFQGLHVVPPLDLNAEARLAERLERLERRMKELEARLRATETGEAGAGEQP